MRGRALAVAALLWSCSTARPPKPSEAAAPTQVTLFLTAELRGALEPCGCSQHMLGGLARTAQLIAAARAGGAPVLYVDAGNALFPSAEISEAQVPQQEAKARTLAAALRAMGVAARVTGPVDLARGEAFLASLDLPPPLPPSGLALLEAGGHTVALLSAAQPGELAALGAAARKQGAVLVVALLAQSWDVAVRAAQDKDLPVDLIVATRPVDGLAGSAPRVGGGAVRVMQPMSKGRGLVRVDAFLHDDGSRVAWLRGPADQERELAALGGRIELVRGQVNDPTVEPALRELRAQKLEELLARREALAAQAPPPPPDRNAAWVRVVPIEATLAADEAVQALVDRYDRAVDALNLALAKESGKVCAQPSPAEVGVVGTGACISCHRSDYAVWKASRHAAALESLSAKHKDHHLDCIGCHLTGWQQRGGVCRVDQVEGREGVGCESCHGPGSAHAAAPRKWHLDSPGEEVCVGCHDPENSPHFAFERFVSKIVVPGHGRPLADAGAAPAR